MKPIAIIGAGPGGLICAQTLAENLQTMDFPPEIHLYDAMPSFARKLLQAGKGGLNLTHSLGLSSLGDFLEQYEAPEGDLKPILHNWGPRELVNWAKELGIETYIGSSGRIFPTSGKALPLHKAWIQRLADLDVCTFPGHNLVGWPGEKQLTFETGKGKKEAEFSWIVFALGGASWPHLGSTGAWTNIFSQKGISLAPWKPANCGFLVQSPGSSEAGWSDRFHAQSKGALLKSVGLTTSSGKSKRGDLVITAKGIEGSPVYSLSAELRDSLLGGKKTVLTLDLAPDRTEKKLQEKWGTGPGKKSLSSFLKSRFSLSSTSLALLFEILGPGQVPRDGKSFAKVIKDLAIPLAAPAPLAKAISSAGGVRWSQLTPELELKAYPGVYVVGEMIDWEAPTGGYLLTAVISQGVWVAKHLISKLI
jgi:uncharacterized flavoprotein (TIGR03862 family)